MATCCMLCIVEGFVCSKGQWLRHCKNELSLVDSESTIHCSADSGTPATRLSAPPSQPIRARLFPAPLTRGVGRSLLAQIAAAYQRHIAICAANEGVKCYASADSSVT